MVTSTEDLPGGSLGPRILAHQPETPWRAGLMAGSVAAVVTALVSLPLYSPSDLVFNSATVAVAAIVIGAAAGGTWRILSLHRRRLLRFSLLCSVGFGVVVLAAVGGEQLLDRSISFGVPLAAIDFSLIGLFTPYLARASWTRNRWLPPVFLATAIMVGLALAGLGDQESIDLELPPRSGGLEQNTPFPG